MKRHQYWYYISNHYEDKILTVPLKYSSATDIQFDSYIFNLIWALELALPFRRLSVFYSVAFVQINLRCADLIQVSIRSSQINLWLSVTLKQVRILTTLDCYCHLLLVLLGVNWIFVGSYCLLKDLLLFWNQIPNMAAYWLYHSNLKYTKIHFHLSFLLQLVLQ